jgi:hypothetical protein
MVNLQAGKLRGTVAISAPFTPENFFIPKPENGGATKEK